MLQLPWVSFVVWGSGRQEEFSSCEDLEGGLENSHCLLCHWTIQGLIMLVICNVTIYSSLHSLYTWRTSVYTVDNIFVTLIRLQEICAVSKISKKEIGRCFKLILKALETQVDLITTGDFMSRFCSNLGLPPSAQKAATHIARKAVDLDIVPGRSPISVAAAAIYMASQVCHCLRTVVNSLHCAVNFLFY